MSDKDLSTAERGPACQSCGVPFDEHELEKGGMRIAKIEIHEVTQ